MATYFVAGCAADPQFAVCERIAAALMTTLPSVHVKVVMEHPDDWDQALARIREATGYGGKGVGPVVWSRSGRIVGGTEEWAKLCAANYGVIVNDLDKGSIEGITETNLKSAARLKRQEEIGKEADGPRALVIVDVQNDFCVGGSLAVPSGDEVIPIINDMRKLKKWDLVVLTQDYHPKDHVSFASNNAGATLFKAKKIEGVGTQMMWPDHCVQGSIGADFHPYLDVAETDVVVQKGKNKMVDSYSGFGDADEGKVEKTELEDVLKENGIKNVFVTGLALDYCVKFTALDAAKKGFKTFLVADATRGITPDAIRAGFDEMKKAGVVVTTSGDIPE